MSFSATAPWRRPLSPLHSPVRALPAPSFHGKHTAGDYQPRPSRCAQTVRAASTSSKGKQLWSCTSCGETTLQWSGQCMSCKAWGSLEKVTVAPVADLEGGGGGGGGGGARAAARFSATRAAQRKSNASKLSRDDEAGPDDAFGTAAAAFPRRSGWVSQDAELPQKLSDVSRRSFRQRWRLRLPGEAGEELGRVLGGGVVPGSLILVGGEPGVGKSTLLLQVADLLTRRRAETAVDANPQVSTGSDVDLASRSQAGDSAVGGRRSAVEHVDNAEQDDAERPVVLYVSGEESTEQIGSRAERMGVGNNSDVYLHAATRMESILQAVLHLRPSALIIDSIQTVYLDDLPSSAGSVVQVRECASALLQVAKRERIPVFLVGHVTKSGDIAGPRILEHIVDVVVYMEGGRQQPLRLVRCVKNRYGATDEVGVFAMEDFGLKAVPNPSAMFLSGRTTASNGSTSTSTTTTAAVSSAVTVVMEGTRPLLMEVQALCSPVPPGSGAPPVRSPTGVRKERLWLLLAVLGKHTAMRTYGVDVHLNVTGGLSVSEPAADLAIAAALASSYYERPIPGDIALIGEVGLGGELRTVAQMERRVAEAFKLGFKRVVVPAGSDVRKSARVAGSEVVECRTVKEACEAVLGPIFFSKTRRRKGSAGARPRFDPSAAAEEEYDDGASHEYDDGH